MAQASPSPCATIGMKSSRLLVANCAWDRMATAAMQQSAKRFARRPVRLKSSAAFSASACSSASASGNSRRARASAAGESGPRRNSPHATGLIPSGSPAPRPAHQLRLLRTARHERINQKIRVEMSHGTSPGAAHSRLVPPGRATIRLAGTRPFLPRGTGLSQAFSAASGNGTPGIADGTLECGGKRKRHAAFGMD